MKLRFLAPLALVVCLSLADASDFDVSSDGSNAWSGTLAQPNRQRDDGPFATLERARDAVRELNKRAGAKDIVVQIPAGAYLLRDSTHRGRSAGLAARILGTAAAWLAAKHPDKYVFFANEIPDTPDAAKEIERFLKAGAVGIGEQNFNLASDSKEMLAIFDLAKEYQIPVLLLFQNGMYNHGLDRFHKILEKYPTVNFIGHAQTWWGNIDEAHAAEFIERHQDKLMFGSDCADHVGVGKECIGAGTLALVRKLVPGAPALRKILSGNARRVIRFD